MPLDPYHMTNQDFDPRHRLGSPVEAPSKPIQSKRRFGINYRVIEVKLRRCATTARGHGCGRIWTTWEIRRAHHCPHCGNRFFRGVDKVPPWTYIRLFVLQLVNSWRVFGPTFGRGWGDHG
jgi:DNA-directed RNA polymerase subunit RPC12/RpoP